MARAHGARARRPLGPARGPRPAAFAPVFASFRDIVGPELAPLALAHEGAEQAAHLDDLREGKGAAVLVAERGGEAVGFAVLTMDEARRPGQVGLDAVHPDHAGRGVGTRLHEAALEGMRARGAVAAAVSTGGDPSRAAARRARAGEGFDPGIPSLHLPRRLRRAPPRRRRSL